MSEKLASQRIHQLGTPLLISDLWLREYGCGQVDLARLKEGHIELFEVKSSMRISKRQLKRLQEARTLIEYVLERKSELALYVRKRKGFDWIPML